MSYCCSDLQKQTESTCPDHPDRKDCPDALVVHHSASGEWGLMIHDGGSSYILIKFCPWCGAELPGPNRSSAL